jgi:hypothetical protein
MTQTQPSRFVRTVREEMHQQRLSVRGLARKIDPHNVDRVRRNLHRWLDEGIVPNRSSRAELAAALGLPAGSLDDEEDEPSMSFGAAMQAMFDRAVAKALADLQPQQAGA